MSMKLKALGLALLAAMAVSAVAVMNAAAESQSTGHFTSSAAHTTLDVKEDASETGAHRLELAVTGLNGIICNEASYVATIEGTTVEDLKITPTYDLCKTTNGDADEVEVTMNGCYYTFKQPNKKAATTENTVDLVCPTAPVEVHHPACTIKIPGQTGLKGVGYTTITENSKHAITLTSTVENITTHFEGGFCVLLGTSHAGELKGAATVIGTNTDKEPVDITATGSEG